MGYYSPNPHYAAADYSADAARVELAERSAGWYFSEATKPQAARYGERMAVAAAYKGSPRWDREREAAQREFKETTTEAAALCEATVRELLATGEVSEEMSARWDALCAAPIAQAAE